MTDDRQPQYAILRTAKIKSFGALAACSKHNDRTTKTGIEHTDGSGSISLLNEENDILKSWNNRAKEVGYDKSKVRKNAVIAVEFVMSASPDWWKTANQEQMQDWIKKSTSFVEKKIGKKNIIQSEMHLDETTGHLHIIGVPFVETTTKARGRNSANKPPITKIDLSAKKLVGGHRDNHIQMQTDYQADVAHLGLTRGKPKKETGARNMRPSQWRAIQSKQLDETMKLHKEAEERLAAIEKREVALNAERKELAKDAQEVINAQINAKEPRDKKIVEISEKRFDLPKEHPSSPNRTKSKDDGQR